MRASLALVLPILLAVAAPRDASAQTFGAVVMPPEPTPPGPIRDTPVMRTYSVPRIVGGSIMGGVGLTALVAGIVYAANIERPACREGELGCALGGISTGMSQILAAWVIVSGIGLSAGGAALALSGGSTASVKRRPIVPETAIGPRSVSLRWTF